MLGLSHLFTFSRLAVVVLDVVVGFVLLVLSQDVLAGHSGDDRQVSWWCLGQRGIALVQQKFAVINDPGPCDRERQTNRVYVCTYKDEFFGSNV